MKLPCQLVGTIAEIVCGMFIAGASGLDSGQVGKMIGAVVRSWSDKLAGEYGMTDEQVGQCAIEGERIGKAFAEFFHREEGG